jgi:hypothetical protein
MINGIKLIDEQVIQEGRRFVITDAAMFDEVPVGSVLIDEIAGKFQIKKLGGTTWEDFLSQEIHVGETPPGDPAPNQLWLDTSDNSELVMVPKFG